MWEDGPHIQHQRALYRESLFFFSDQKKVCQYKYSHLSITVSHWDMGCLEVRCSEKNCPVQKRPHWYYKVLVASLCHWRKKQTPYPGLSKSQSWIIYHLKERIYTASIYNNLANRCSLHITEIKEKAQSLSVSVPYIQLLFFTFSKLSNFFTGVLWCFLQGLHLITVSYQSTYQSTVKTWGVDSFLY